MSDLRLRIELNKGGIGISFHKLAEISVEAEKFLRMIIADVDRRITGTWIAKDFDNSSVDFTAEFSGNITQEQAVLCSNALDATMKEDFDFAELEHHRVRRATLLQYTKIAKALSGADAHHLATAVEAGCEEFITYDNGFLKKKDKIKGALGIRVVKGHESHFLPVEPPPEPPASNVAVRSGAGQGGLFNGLGDKVAEAEELRSPEEDGIDDE